MDTDGTAAFVTGAAQGIGLGICRALAGAGVRLAIADIDLDGLGTARTELSRSTDVEAYHLDVRDRSRYAHVADEAEAALGPISILCNNAGVGGDAVDGDRAPSMSYETWDWVLGINLGGVVNGIQTFVPRMIERRQGHIVNTSSGAGLVVDPTWRVGFMYPCSKHAVVGLSEGLRNELERHGIGVSVLCPGPVATNIHSNTARTRPASQPRPSSVPPEQLDAALHTRGVSPDAVGAMVLTAITSNQPFVLTDRVVSGAFGERAASIHDAMPATNPAVPANTEGAAR